MTRQGERLGVPDLTRHDPRPHRGPDEPLPRCSRVRGGAGGAPETWTLSEYLRDADRIAALLGEGTPGKSMSRPAAWPVDACRLSDSIRNPMKPEDTR